MVMKQDILFKYYYHSDCSDFRSGKEEPLEIYTKHLKDTSKLLLVSQNMLGMTS